MSFQTKLPLIKETRNPIDYNSHILLLGSCFSENIGSKLNYFKFQSTQNPFGILFHPLAIENLITRAINQEKFSEKEVFLFNEKWHCNQVHSSLSAVSKTELIDNLNRAIFATENQLKKTTHLFLTLGTAWVYRHKKSDSIVANCHKIPQKEFTKELLTVDEIVESLASIITLCKNVNPSVQIIFTASPVRHLKDGFIQNQQSKAHLIAGIHQVIEPRNNIFYFPSYEIMMDELRDYRFYADDMIHPSDLAIEYIFSRFSETWIAESSHQTMQIVDSIQKGFAHKPFYSNSNTHQKFIESLNKKIELLKEKHPHINF